MAHLKPGLLLVYSLVATLLINCVWALLTFDLLKFLGNFRVLGRAITLFIRLLLVFIYDIFWLFRVEIYQSTVSLYLFHLRVLLLDALDVHGLELNFIAEYFAVVLHVFYFFTNELPPCLNFL